MRSVNHHVVWHREELNRITDAVTEIELDTALLRDGNRVMWIARTGQGICVLVLGNEGHGAEAHSLGLDCFLVDQGY